MEKILYEDDVFYAMEDGFPVSQGHCLIIPKMHIENWFDASEELQHQLMKVLGKMRHSLAKKYSPDGFNVGMNCGASAGQTIMHLHIHLIPRYFGDMTEPRGGVRGVIPGKQGY